MHVSYVDRHERLNRLCSAMHLYPVKFDLLVVDQFLSYFPADVTEFQIKTTLNMLCEVKAYYDAQLAPQRCSIILTESEESLKTHPPSLLAILQSFCHVTVTMRPSAGERDIYCAVQ
jgi:hypothetical protein